MRRENSVKGVKLLSGHPAGLLAASGNRLATASSLNGLESRLSCRLVLSASVYALARLLVAILLLRAQAEAERDLELFALRRQRLHGLINEYSRAA